MDKTIQGHGYTLPHQHTRTWQYIATPSYTDMAIRCHTILLTRVLFETPKSFAWSAVQQCIHDGSALLFEITYALHHLWLCKIEAI